MSTPPLAPMQLDFFHRSFKMVGVIGQFVGQVKGGRELACVSGRHSVVLQPLLPMTCNVNSGIAQPRDGFPLINAKVRACTQQVER